MSGLLSTAFSALLPYQVPFWDTEIGGITFPEIDRSFLYHDQICHVHESLL